MTPPSDRLAEIEARLKKATPGPWHAYERGKVWSGCKGFPRQWVATVQGRQDAAERAADTEFIAHCGGDKGDVAWLIEEVKRLRQQVADMDETNDGWLRANAPGGWIDDMRQKLRASGAKETGPG